MAAVRRSSREVSGAAHQRPREWHGARVSGHGRPPPLRPSGARPQPARAGRSPRRVAEPHLAGRDGPRQAVGQHPVRDRQRAQRLARRAALQRSRPAGGRAPCPWPQHADAGVAPSGGTPHPIQRADSRKSIRLASGVVWERLTTASDPAIDFLAVTYEVGGASSPEHEFQRHGGQEWGYVVSGTLGVTIGFDDYVLRPGDAIAIDSTIPHRLYNVGDEPVHGIWFVLGRRPVGRPGGDGQPRLDRRAAADRRGLTARQHARRTSTRSTGRSRRPRQRPAGTISGLGRSVLVDARRRGRAHGARRGPPRSGRLARPPRPLVRGGALRPRGQLVLELDGRAWRLVAGDFALIPDRRLAPRSRNLGSERGPLAVREHARCDAPPSDPRRDTFFRPGAAGPGAARGRAASRRSGSRRCAGSATTTARRPSSRRCASRGRPAAARRPGWTPPSWPTAGSP